MAKAKKKTVRQSVPKAPVFPAASLPPQVLEQAAQGWLHSSGATAPAHRPTRPASDDRLAEILTETLQQLRGEISELRARLDRLENR